LTHDELVSGAEPPGTIARPPQRRLSGLIASRAPVIALAYLLAVLLAASFAPLLTGSDPGYLDPGSRLQPMSVAHPLGTDALGRDLYARILYGGRVSLAVGFGVTVVSVAFGLLAGVLAGYFRACDRVIMQMMDGLMAIPSILLAIALVALWGGGLGTVILAISVPELPRVVRLVRSAILKARAELYVEAAISLGARPWRLLMRHLVPNTIAPLLIQGTFVFSSAMLTEAAMSFLGIGLPSEIPSWGNIMAEGRKLFQLKPGLILFAGFVLAGTILSLNLLGDAARDALDPKLASDR
jgi:peptide/nickel transport system permease protein